MHCATDLEPAPDQVSLRELGHATWLRICLMLALLSAILATNSLRYSMSESLFLSSRLVLVSIGSTLASGLRCRQNPIQHIFARRRHLLIRKRNSCTDRVFPGICIHMELHKVYWYQNRRRCLKAETQLLEEKLLWKKKVRATKPFFWTRMSIHRRRAN